MGQGSATSIPKWHLDIAAALPCGVTLLANIGKRAENEGASPVASDGELARLTLGGDKHAYEMLVRRYQKLVFNVVHQICQQHEVAAELTQETFLRAYKALASFDQSAKFKPWLLRIATNLSLNARRDSKEHVSLEAMMEDQPDAEPPSNANVEQEVELRLSQELLIKALCELPDRHRSAFLLRYQHDLSYAEIAYVLKESESSVKALLFRIREKLRKTLWQELAADYSQNRQ